VALPLLYSPEWETKNEEQFPNYVSFKIIENSNLNTHVDKSWGWGVYGKKLNFSESTEHIYNEEFSIDNHTWVSPNSPIFCPGFGRAGYFRTDRYWLEHFWNYVPTNWDARYELMNLEEDNTFFRRHLSDDVLEAYYHGDLSDSKALTIDTTKSNSSFTSEHARKIPGKEHTYHYSYESDNSPIIHFGEVKSITIASHKVNGSGVNVHQKMVEGNLDNTTYFSHKPTSVLPIEDSDQKPLVFRSVAIINPVAHGTRRQINDVAYNSLVLVPQVLKRRGWNRVMYKVYGGTPAPDFSVGPKDDPTATQENPSLKYVEGYGAWKMKLTRNPYAWNIDNSYENSQDYQLGDGTVETNYGVKEKIKFEYDYNPTDTYKGLPLRGRYVFDDFTYENNSGRLSIGTSSEGGLGDHVPFDFTETPRRVIKIPKLNAAWKNITINSLYNNKAIPLLHFGSGIINIRSVDPVSEDTIPSSFYSISDDYLSFIKSNKNISWETVTSYYA